MSELTRAQAASREKTLLVSLLLSAWAPLTTGIAVLMSQSTTQLGDFTRRTIELAALFISWLVFRYLERHQPAPARRARLEKIAGLSVAGALGGSSLVMLVIAVSRLSSFQPGGNVYLGLAIAALGLATNGWFWRRYTRFLREQHNSIIDTQRQLYMAKSFVDLCVIIALAAVALAPAHPATRYIDLLGSFAIVLYLLWSAVRTARGVGKSRAGGMNIPAESTGHRPDLNP